MEISDRLQSKAPSDKDWQFYVVPPLTVAALWAGIALLFWVTLHFDGMTAVSVFTFLGIALLQNCLMLLHHEGAHFLLFPARRVNDWITDIFCGLPFGESLSAYRDFHFKHHRLVGNQSQDPEVPYYNAQGYFYQPRSLRDLAGSFALDLSGYNWLQFTGSFLWDRVQNFSARRNFFSTLENVWTLSVSDKTLRPLLFLSSLVILLVVFKDTGLWKVLLTHWILPQATLTFFLGKLRSYGEHGPRQSGVIGSTYFHEQGLVYRLCIAPLNGHLHLEHHLYPAVPFFRLPKVREEMGFVTAPVIEGFLQNENSLLKKVLWNGQF